VAEHLIIVEHRQDWLAEFPDLNVVLASEYLADPQRYRSRGIRLINLCRSYRYLSEGYYCSLLAEARRHKILPSVRTLTDLSRKSIYSLGFDDFEQRLQRLSKNYPGEAADDNMELLVCFGRSQDEQLQEFARQLFEMLPCPILKITFKRKQQWQIHRIKPVALNNLDNSQREFFIDALQHHLSSRWRSPKQKNSARYDMAILYNPREALPPSNMAALRKFMDAGKRLGLEVELIQRRDYNRLGEYDALFIRETTGIDHYTYRFAKKAEAEGLVVMDDPDSIVKCTNKVYLTELLQTNKVPVPNSVILRKGEDLQRLQPLGFPLVLKIPDGSFSRGIYKAENQEQARQYSQSLFKDSDLILAQEYVYTEFDWRIGILNRQPLFACQYFMSKAHWQIVRHDDSGRAKEGGYKAWSLQEVPAGVVDIALRAANLIGDSFYGVDIKQTDKGILVMEVNDNPNAETGVEDAVLGNAMYESIMGEFLRRLEKRTTRLQENQS
jgi:glutathione synthase/RimK-type ligase-like ATP-grasp enzyme